MHEKRIALRQERAAKSLDISVPTFKILVAEGVLPRPISLGSIKLWRVDELDKALTLLPRACENASASNSATEAIAKLRREVS